MCTSPLPSPLSPHPPDRSLPCKGLPAKRVPVVIQQAYLTVGVLFDGPRDGLHLFPGAPGELRRLEQVNRLPEVQDLWMCVAYLRSVIVVKSENNASE